MNQSDRYKHQIMGARARAAGQRFEKQIDTSLDWYFSQGLLKANKTPEPMKPIRPMGKNGQFLACYEKKAQVDFSGTMLGGRAVRFEAKQTDTEKFERNRLTKEQLDDLTYHSGLGALCFVLLCFGFDRFYRVPWKVWDNMKAIFGRQYVTEPDIRRFRIPYISGVIKIFHEILSPSDLNNKASLPNFCVRCGEYTGIAGDYCSECKAQLRGD